MAARLKSTNLLRCLGAAFGCALPLVAQATIPTRAPHRDLRVLVLRPSGLPLANAKVTFFPQQRLGLAWPELDDLRQASATGVTDVRGEARIEATAELGDLLVEHQDGLGALHSAASTARLVRVDTQPCGGLTASPPGQDLALRLAFLTPTGATIPIGVRTGARIVVPAGRWRYFGTSGQRLCAGAAFVVSGRESQVTAPDPKDELALALPSEGDYEVRLSDWPLALPIDEHRRVRFPGGPDVRRVLVLEKRPNLIVHDEVWLDASSARPLRHVALPTPTRRVRILDAERQPLRGALLVSLLLVGDRPSVRAVSTSQSDGIAVHVLPGPTERGAILVLAPNHAIQHLAVTREPIEEVVIAPADQLRILARTPDGSPLPGIRFTLRPSAAPWLGRDFETDGHGYANLGSLAREPHELAFQQPGFVRWQRPIGTEEIEAGKPIVVEAVRGESVRGRVFGADERPVAGATVTLRDTRGRGGIEARHTTSDANGGFEFTGVPDLTFTLSASLERAGVTYSGQRSGVQPGPDEWGVIVRSEDVPPPHRK